jgi:hypothetical protein
MAKKKAESDVNVNAFEILKALTGESSPVHNNGKKPKQPPAPQKNPAAVALGRLGGLKGGKARAESLSSKRKIEIAQKAARSRWDRPH